MRGKMIIESEADFAAWQTAQQTFEQSRKSDARRDMRASAQ
jgi:cytochrome c oxidase subunit 2